MNKRQQQHQDCRLALKMERQLQAERKEWLEQVTYRTSRFGEYAGELQKVSARLTHFDMVPGIARAMRNRMRTLAAEMIDDLQALGNILEHRQEGLTFSELLGELGQIRSDFGPFRYNPKQSILSVETDAIELEDRYLGPFDIRLDVRSLGQADPRHTYKVVATDPHPASGDSSITHPHVSDDRLCEGDASVAIRNALQAGRLGDFFTIVGNVLNTYNGGSAYISLDRWEGSTCWDCGAHVRHDSEYTCERCDQEFCGDCTYSCIECERTVCRNCSVRCSGCDDRLCNECTTACSGCHDQFCGKCLKDGICEGCRQEREDGQEQEVKEKDHEPQPKQPESVG